MRVEVDIGAGGALSTLAEQRLRLVLTRFAASVIGAALRTAETGEGRLVLRARVRLVGGEVVALAAEDWASEAATLHFIDRLGRAVARRLTATGGRHG
jgi:hypothetical protein